MFNEEIRRKEMGVKKIIRSCYRIEEEAKVRVLKVVVTQRGGPSLDMGKRIDISPSEARFTKGGR